MVGPLHLSSDRPNVRRRILQVASLGTCACLALVGCGLDLSGELAEDDAGSPGSSPPLNGDSGSSSGSSGGGLSSGSSGSSSGNPGKGDDGPGDDASGAPDAPSGPKCNYSGTWATKITIDVNWVPQGLMGVILAPGTGKIQQWIDSVRVQTGLTTTDTAVVCGIGLPDFSGTSFVGGETYGVRFPNSLFDNSYLPSFAIHGTLGDSSPQSTFITTAAAALIGLTLPNPTTAAWPTPVATAVDSDMDGVPGVTVNAASGPVVGMDAHAYSDFPVDVIKSRANQLYLVIRQVTALSGKAADCDHIFGSVSIPKIPTGTPSTDKYAIDSHVIGCALTAGGPCSSNQVSFIDTTQPVFSPSGSATFTSIRVNAGTKCPDVRAMLPAQ